RFAAALGMLAQFRQPLVSLGGSIRLFLEHRLTRRGDGELAALVLAVLLGDQPFVGEHRQRRVDHAGARRIVPVGEFLHRLDQVVAMARLLGDQLEQDQAQLAPIEHPPAPAPRPTATAERTARSERATGTERPLRAERTTGAERTARSETGAPAAACLRRHPPSAPEIMIITSMSHILSSFEIF